MNSENIENLCFCQGMISSIKANIKDEIWSSKNKYIEQLNKIERRLSKITGVDLTEGDSREI